MSEQKTHFGITISNDEASSIQIIKTQNALDLKTSSLMLLNWEAINERTKRNNKKEIQQ